jgi:hypothetical protein
MAVAKVEKRDEIREVESAERAEEVRAGGTEVIGEGKKTEDMGKEAVSVVGEEEKAESPVEESQGKVEEREDRREEEKAGPPLGEHQEEAYCVKCRQKREMLNVKRIVTKNGRSALEGTCAVCGTRLFRFVAGGKEKSV